MNVCISEQMAHAQCECAVYWQCAVIFASCINFQKLRITGLVIQTVIDSCVCIHNVNVALIYHDAMNASSQSKDDIITVPMGHVSAGSVLWSMHQTTTMTMCA